MKVCLLNDSFPPVIDGVANVVLNYANCLHRDLGAEVIVGTPRYPDADYDAYPYPVIPYQSFDTTAVTSGYRTGNPFAQKAISALADFRPDLIHSHCPMSSTVMARLLREGTGAPVVFTYHTKYDIDIARAVKPKLAAQEGIRAMVGNISACDEVWVVSRGAGESLKALGFQGDYRVMHNGVDFERGRTDRKTVAQVTAGYDLPEETPVFLFVGRLMTYKGLPLILDALRMLAGSGQDFRMVFVGQGPDRALLEQRAREYGLMGGAEPDRVIFTGAVYDREALRAWNTRANLFLFPSTFDTNGLVVREAAACGLASVLIEGSCAAEGVTDGRNGFTIRETPEALAALLADVVKDPARLRQMGQHAMDELYLSWQSCVAEAYERYGALLDANQREILPKRRKDPADYLLSLTARGMEEQERIRRIGRTLFGDFKETAVGMMENIQDPGEATERFWDRMSGDVERGLNFLWKDPK